MDAPLTQPPIHIGGVEVPAGQRRLIDLRIPHLYTHAALTIPVRVLHGRRPGPRLCRLQGIQETPKLVV